MLKNNYLLALVFLSLALLFLLSGCFRPEILDTKGRLLTNVSKLNTSVLITHKGVSLNVDFDTDRIPLLNAKVTRKGNMDIISATGYELRSYPTFHGVIPAHEIELVLKKRPLVNKFYFKLSDNGVRYEYQPPLDEELGMIGIAGCNATECLNHFRPIDVVGSYAVIKDDSLVMMIYRPLVTDDSGKQTWGMLNISNGELSVEVDSWWLISANYPVIIDPTYGYTSIGGSYLLVEDTILLGKITVQPSISGKNTSEYLTNVSVYIVSSGSGP